MNWRTDKPTADLIVADVFAASESLLHRFRILIKPPYGDYMDCNNAEVIDYALIIKWADLGEDETATDCHELKEAAEEYAKDETMSGLAERAFKAGANWQKRKETLPKDLDEAAEEYAYNNWQSDDYHIGASEGLPFDAIGHTEACFKDGANWQREQDHYACRQCDKNDDITFYKGMQHAIEMMKEAAIERTVKEDAGGYPYIDETELYDYENDEPTAKKGDKVKVYIFR